MLLPAKVAGQPDGTYLFRDQPGNDENFVLVLRYNGKSTHHLIQPAEDGTLNINKRRFGEFRTLAEVRANRNESLRAHFSR